MMETININMTPCNEVETIHASQNDTSLRKWGIRPYDYDGNDVTNQQDKATLVDIKGQTLKWNQLIQNGNFADTTNWKAQSGNSSLSVANNVATVTLNGGSPSPYNPALSPITFSQSIANHKYYVHVEMLSPADGILYDGGGTVTRNVLQHKPISANVWTTFQGIGNAQAEGDVNDYLGLQNASSVLSLGDSLSYRNYMVIDLTQLFGSTLADSIYNMEQSQSGSGVAYFKSLFPLPYYSYNQGSLLSFNGNGIKTVGKNLLMPSTVTWSDVSYVDGYYDINVTANAVTERRLFGNWEIQNAVSLGLTSGTYIWTTERLGINTPTVSVRVSVHGTESYVTWSVGTPRYINSDDKFFILLYFGSAGTYNGKVGIQLEFGSNATAYEPYTESIATLPISTYFPSGMKQAWNVYDELTPSKAITRVGSVDLGTLDWATYSSPERHVFRAYILSNMKQPNGANFPNAMCSRYEPMAYSPISANDDGYFAIGAQRIVIIEHDYTDPVAFKESLSNVYLYYELATPIETAISPELDLTFNIDKGGTEELLPSSLMNGSVDLGSLTWTLYGANNHEFTAELPNMKVGTTNASIPSLGVNAVANYAQWTAQRPNDSLYKDSNGKLHLRLNPYTTVAELTSALQGVYLWYETTDSTPTTTPLNATIKYPAETKDVYFTYQVSDFLSTIFKFYLVTKGIQIPCELEDDTLVADCTSEISNEPGFFYCKIKAENDLGQIFSNKFQLHIERSPQ